MRTTLLVVAASMTLTLAACERKTPATGSTGAASSASSPPYTNSMARSDRDANTPAVTDAEGRWGATTTTQPDNTAANRRDLYPTTLPMDQSQTQSDINITAAIRRSLVSDGNLTMWDDKNCKITTYMGLVTLRGPVSGVASRNEIEAKARAVPGVTDVRNMLDVKGTPTTVPAELNLPPAAAPALDRGVAP